MAAIVIDDDRAGGLVGFQRTASIGHAIASSAAPSWASRVPIEISRREQAPSFPDRQEVSRGRGALDMDAALADAPHADVASGKGGEDALPARRPCIGTHGATSKDGGRSEERNHHEQHTGRAPHHAGVRGAQTIPENRVYVSADRADALVRSFVGFSHGRVIDDDGHAPGSEAERANDTYRRIRMNSSFGKMTVAVSDGHLPYPYGRELTGYEVTDLVDTLAKARAAGIAVGPQDRQMAMVRFPGDYIAEIRAKVLPNPSQQARATGGRE